MEPSQINQSGVHTSVQVNPWKGEGAEAYPQSESVTVLRVPEVSSGTEAALLYSRVRPMPGAVTGRRGWGSSGSSNTRMVCSGQA